MLKERLRKRDRLFGGWLSFSHPSITEIFGNAGFDFMAVDMEHSTISLDQAQRIIAASQAAGVPCLPRAVSHSNDHFKPLLDSGADGLLVQMVETPEQVEHLVDCLKYPPAGKRTFGLNRAQSYGFEFDSYIEKWNEESVLLLQIESASGVENIDSLLGFEEVDGVMIGPYDMSGSLGVPGQVHHPKVAEASERVIRSCLKFGKSCGTQLADPDRKSVEDLIGRGHNFVFMGSDLFVLWKWCEKTGFLMDSLR